MKLKDGFITHVSGGEHILVSAGASGFSGLVRSNPTAAFIIEKLKVDTTQEAIVDALLAEYDVSRDRASADVAETLKTLHSIGALVL